MTNFDLHERATLIGERDALAARLAEAERELDSVLRAYQRLSAESCDLIAARDKSAKREQALAAHLERAREASVGLRNLMTAPGSSAEHYLNKMFDALEDQPETSLARLIAEHQRRALRQAAMRYKKYVTTVNLRDFGDELVRQAQGGGL